MGDLDRKLFVFDIDGTLLNNQHEVMDSTLDAIAQLKLKGHEVAIATGRALFHAIEIIEQLEFKHYIVNNGAAGFMDGKQVYKKTLNPNELDRFIQEMAKLEVDVAVQDLVKIKRLSNFDTKKINTAMFNFAEPLPEYEMNYHQNKEIYQGLAFYNESEAAQVESGFDQFSFVRWHEQSVDVIPKDSSKAVTMLKFAEDLKVPIENVVAFGDGLNDKEMLSTAGTGVVMGNGHSELKQNADLLTRSNDEHGIWHALKELNLL